MDATILPVVHCGSKVSLLEANVALALQRDDLEAVEEPVRRALGD